MKRRKKQKKILKLIIIFGLIGGIVFFYYHYFKMLTLDTVIIDNDNHEENRDNIDYDKYQTYEDVSMLKYEKGTIIERLKDLSKIDKRINDIIDDYNTYPEVLLEDLSRNVELTDFVLNYKEKKDKVYSDNIGNVTKGEYPLLLQWDERWGYGKYGSSNVAISGCGPTSLAMVIAGLTGKGDYTPYEVGKYAYEHGYYLESSGTTWDLMRKGANHFGLKSRELPLDETSIKNALNNGHPIICSMRKGDFTINGHYIVLVGVQDGKIKVNDPNSKIRSNILWDYSRLKGQIKNLWEFYTE